MENEVMEMAANEGMDTCSTMVNTCSIGKALLITAVLGGTIVMGIKFIKKIRAKKKTINIEMATSENTQSKK